jgi:hypothetical protein
MKPIGRFEKTTNAENFFEGSRSSIRLSARAMSSGDASDDAIK